jgi:hypothetical protein
MFEVEGGIDVSVGIALLKGTGVSIEIERLPPLRYGS